MKRRSLLLPLVAAVVLLFAMTAFAAGSISVTLNDYSLNVGDSVDMSGRLTVIYSNGTVLTNVTNDCAVAWSGSSSAFTRSGSVVRGVQRGSGTVSASVAYRPASDTNLFGSDSATVSVYGNNPRPPYPPRPDNVPVTAISVPATLNVAVGGTVFLPVTYYPANATQRQVNYIVGNTSIASVSYAGMVSGKSKGYTDITVYAANNTNARSTCRVYVGDSGGNTSASGVTVSPSRLSMSVGQTSYLSVSVTPYTASQDVTFSSSAPSVVSVDGRGKVSANRSGTATIYVRSAANRNKYATVSVTVGSGSSGGTTTARRAKSVSITPKTLSLTAGETGYVSARVSPTSANQSVTYSVGNPRIATVDANGTVRARSAGTTTVYAYSSVNRNLYATCIVTVSKGAPVRDDTGYDEEDIGGIGSTRLNGVTVPGGQVSRIEANGVETDAYVVDDSNKKRRMTLSLTEADDGGVQLCVEPSGGSESVTLRMTAGSINDLLDEGVEEIIVFNSECTGAMTFDLEKLLSNTKTAARRAGASFTGGTEVSLSMVQRDYSELGSKARRALNKLGEDELNSSLFETGVSIRATKGGKLKAYDITKRMPSIELSMLADDYARGMIVRQCKLNKTTFTKASTATVKLNGDYYCTASVAPGSIAAITLG